MNRTEAAFAREESQHGSVWPSCGRASLAGRSVLWLALFLALASGGLAMGAQVTQGNGGQRTSRPLPTTEQEVNPSLSGSPSDRSLQQKRLRQLNVAQHKALVSDTDKLLKLVAELNEEIDKTTPASLTPDQLRRVAEIEKLAHSVKDKMRSSLVGAPDFLDAPPPFSSSPSRR